MIAECGEMANVINSFIIATATGVPPLVPVHVIDGTFRVLINAFDFAAFTNPTGVAIINRGLIPFLTKLYTVIAADGEFPITMIES